MALKPIDGESAIVAGRLSVVPCGAGCGRVATRVLEIPLVNLKAELRARLEIDTCSECCEQLAPNAAHFVAALIFGERKRRANQ